MNLNFKNKKLNILMLIVIILAVAVCIAFYRAAKQANNIESKVESNLDAEKFAEEYTLVGKDNVFVYKDIDEIIDILEEGTGIVYLGFPECPWCQHYVVYLNEVAKENNLGEIYYFDILEDRKNNTEKYQKIVSLLDGYLLDDQENNPRVYVPDVTAVVDGKIVGHDNETSTISDSTPEEYWTEEKINNLKSTFKSMILQVVGGVCTNCNE